MVTNADYPLLEKVADSAIKDRQKFERLIVSKEKLLDMFYVSRKTPSSGLCVIPMMLPSSITSIRSISLRLKFPMVHLLPCIVADPW